MGHLLGSCYLVYIQLCRAIVKNSLDGRSPIENLAYVHEKQHGAREIDISWESYVAYFLSNTTDPNDIAWTWQTCTEFGFYQTCEPHSNCPFARGYHPLSEDMELCKLLFGITPGEVEQNVQDILDWFGGWKIQGTRIMFVNGDMDPWAQQAVTPDHVTSTKWQPTIWVRGASHHFWTHPVEETDDIEVVKAREMIYHTVSTWLMMGDDSNADKGQK